MSQTRTFCSALFSVVMFAGLARATEVQTTSYSAWLNTVSGVKAEWDFNVPNNTYNTSSGYSLSVGSFGPITVTGPDAGGYNLTKNPGYGPSNAVTLEGAGDGVGNMTFTPTGAGLTGFLLGVGISGNASPVTVTLSDGEVFTLNPSVGSNVFLGLSSATPITSFVLSTATGSQVELSDFFAAVSNQPADTPAPTAEVATALMIGTGLLFFGARRKVFSNLTSLKA